MKKIITYFILTTILTTFNIPVIAEEYSGDVIRGHIEIYEGQGPKNDYFTGEQDSVDKGKTINMTVSEVMSSGDFLLRCSF